MRTLWQVVLTTLAVLVVSCAPVVVPPLDSFGNIQKQYDVQVGWKATVAPDSVAVSGVLRNDRYSYIHGVELTAVIKDNEGKPAGKKTFLFAGEIPMDEESPFDLVVPVAAGHTPRSIEFTYLYRIRGERMAVPIFHSFEKQL